MDDRGLCAYISAWRHRYPQQRDSPIEDPFDADELGLEDWLRVIDWKLQSDGRWRTRARREIAQHSDERLRALSSDAKSCIDDDAALEVIKIVQGVGEATASAVLAVQDPARFTIDDSRARRTLRLLQSQRLISEHSISRWREDLSTCREIARTCSLSLREVDHALWTANGRESTPS